MSLEEESPKHNKVLEDAILREHKSISKFIRKTGVSPTLTWRLIYLTLSPFYAKGGWRNISKALSDALFIPPDDLFPLHLYGQVHIREKVEVCFRDLAVADQQRVKQYPDPHTPFDHFVARELAAVVWDALQELTSMQQSVIRLRMGLRDGRDYTSDEVARLLGLLPSDVRRIEYKALRRLRHPKRGRRLREFHNL